MPRIPLILRALVLVPLLAVAVDLARATLACGPRAESCLEAAGQGWLGIAAPLLLVLYAAGLALAVGGLARGATSGTRRPASCGSGCSAAPASPRSAAVRRCLPGRSVTAAALGGGWPELLAFCLVAGAVLALALRIAPAAAALVRSLRPDAPRLRMAPALVRHLDAARPHGPATRFALVTRERGPPSRPD